MGVTQWRSQDSLFGKGVYQLIAKWSWEGRGNLTLKKGHGGSLISPPHSSVKKPVGVPI